MEVRTRFAPSPTGSMHVGNARTAIFSWLFAKHHGGKLVLRIEDTDKERSTKENEEKLLKDLSWLGVTWDEGPFRQSERMQLYKDYAEKLVEEGKAFYCFCTDEELDAKRELAEKEKRPPHYDGTCHNLSKEEIEANIKAGKTYTIRFKVEQKDTVFNDLIKGELTMKAGMFGDFVIVRSTGMPVYNFAVVVDDALMKITHIIRAEEHLSNTARQIMLYEAMSFDLPFFAHTALILAEDGSKLSKRHGATSVAEYRKKGYLAEGLFNYLSILGWTPPEEGKEKLSQNELTELFDIKRVSKSSGKFDIQKLNWLNSEYIKELDEETVYERCFPYLKEAYDLSIYSEQELRKIIGLCSGGLECFEQIVENASLFFNELTDDIPEAWSDDSFKELAKRLHEELSKVENADEEFFKTTLKAVGKELKLKGKNLFMPTRIFVSGQEHGPDLYPLMEVLGKDRILKRLSRCI